MITTRRRRHEHDPSAYARWLAALEQSYIRWNPPAATRTTNDRSTT